MTTAIVDACRFFVRNGPGIDELSYPYRSRPSLNFHALGLPPARNGTPFRTTVMSNSIPSLPADLKQFAFLLDVDGTILDLAPTPREVFVSHELPATLTRLR